MLSPFQQEFYCLREHQPMNTEELLAQSLRCLEGFAVHEIEVPQTYAQVSRTEQQGSLEMQSRFFEVLGRGHFRSANLRAPKIGVFNFFFYPQPHFQLPVFSTQFVRLGTRPIIGVIDAKCLIPSMTSREPVIAALQQTHQSYSQLENAGDPPDWYSACRSGGDFFIRPKDLLELETAMEACLHVWAQMMDIIQQPAIFTPADAETHGELIQAYKRHHRENSPGLPLLIRSFGSAWTHEYLSRYFFA